jgi:hypothetical protein
MPRVRINESTSDWKPTDPEIDADALGIAMLMKEFEENYDVIKVKSKRNEEIKENLKRFGKNFEIKVNGQPEWRVRDDGAFMPKQFAAAYPATYAEFLRPQLKEVFDLDAFKAAQPMLYREFRTQRLEKIKNK